MSFYKGEPPDSDLDEDIDPHAEHLSPCGCHDPACVLDDRDTSNVRIGKAWFVYACALQRSNLVAACALAAMKRDEVRDSFNQERR